jgi:type IV secretion system protein VirD4
MPGPKKDAQGLITEAGDMVVYCAGFPAIYGRQPLYFEDETCGPRGNLAAEAERFTFQPGVEVQIV